MAAGVRSERGQSHRSALALTQGNMDQERLKQQQEMAAAALYQQLQHQQFLQLVGRYGAPRRPWRLGPAGPVQARCGPGGLRP